MLVNWRRSKQPAPAFDYFKWRWFYWRLIAINRRDIILKRLGRCWRLRHAFVLRRGISTLDKAGSNSVSHYFFRIKAHRLGGILSILLRLSGAYNKIGCQCAAYNVAAVSSRTRNRMTQQ